MNAINTTTPLPEEWGERISAYLDGELSPAEAIVVERHLAEDPAAQRYADELRSMSQAFRATPEPVFENDLASGIVAEALRRQAEEAADLLEPEGDFGLPFGKASRTWAWAGVAVAAAVMFSFYGRPDQPKGNGPQIAGIQQANQNPNLVAFQKLVPNLRVKERQLTPAQMVRLQQVLAMQSAKQAKLPGELMTVSRQQGVTVETIDPNTATGDEQLLYVDADEAELDRLLAQVDDDSLSQVGPDRSPAVAAEKTVPATPSVRAVPMRIQLTPELIAKLQAQQKQAGAEPGQRRVIVLRIRVQKPTAP